MARTTSSSYIPFARKYRPANFSALLGQEVLTKILSYCILNNRLAQAHLLTGIRGVGKTSSARIIAKTINCTALAQNGENISPCEKCKNCEGFNNHSHPDIIEVDAASRTSVDDIREIIESSEYKPLLGAYKVFIIDEVHMLSKSAFNALLKIIEEPPAHVIFLFATTEVQKIPLTVISRCQRYDLRRLTFEEIHTLIENIANKEGLKLTEEASKIIAIQSEGSARDATAMLDQAASYVHQLGESTYITAESVNKMLGLVQASVIIRLTQLIISNSPAKAIGLLAEIYANASSLEHFIQAMSDFIADLIKTKVITGYHNPLYNNHSTEISVILTGMSLSRLTILWQIFSNGVKEIRASHNELVHAEMLIIKAIYSCNLPSAEEILDAQSVMNTNPPALAQEEETIYEGGDSTIASSPSIFDFLKYCHKHNEMEIYYLLLNEVEIKKFNEKEMEIGSISSISHADKIKTLLHNWSGDNWKIINSKQDIIHNLKSKMLEEVRANEDFQIIKNHFPSADISDIILKA